MPRAQLSIDEVAATRQRLTALALELYLREGLEAVSFRRLAEVAGISHTLPYRYFENKEALVVALRTHCTVHFDRYVRGRERADALPVENIRRIAAAYLSFVQAHPGEYQLIFTLEQASPDHYPELLAARRRFFEHAVELIQRAIDLGEMRGEARVLAHLFWSSLHGLLTLQLGGQLVHGCSLEELVTPLVERMIASSAPQEQKTPAPRPRRRA